MSYAVVKRAAINSPFFRIYLWSRNDFLFNTIYRTRRGIKVQLKKIQFWV